MSKGKLFLIPAPISINSPFGWDVKTLSIITEMRYFIVEEIRTARKLLRRVIPSFPIDECTFQILNEHTPPADIPTMLQPMMKGHDMGLMSEGGIPCIADPGAVLVWMAHCKNIQVIPLPGSSSIFLALAASGFNGQNFCFHGYLPVEIIARKQRIIELEQKAKHQTQIFIETPYRNISLLGSIMQYCQPTTNLCIASGLLSPNEFIKTMEIKQWKAFTPPIHRVPAVFLLGNVYLTI